MPDFNELQKQQTLFAVFEKFKVALTAGDNLKITTTKDKTETVLIDHTVPVGKVFEGRIYLRGDLD